MRHTLKDVLDKVQQRRLHAKSLGNFGIKAFNLVSNKVITIYCLV
jgi:hypothetical protein